MNYESPNDRNQYNRGYDHGYDQAEENEYYKTTKCLERLESLRDEVKANSNGASEAICACIKIVKDEMGLTEGE